jgi:hypothetical protein
MLAELFVFEVLHPVAAHEPRLAEALREQPQPGLGLRVGQSSGREIVF